MTWTDIAIAERRRAVRRFAARLFATNIRATLATRGAFVAQAVFMALNNVVFFVFWWVLFRRVPNVDGWRLQDVEALFGITATSVGLVVAVAGGVRHLGECIEEGQLDVILAQPKPVLLYALGLRSKASGFGDVASGAALVALSGYLSGDTAVLVLLAIVASAGTFLGCGIVFFSLPFWLGRSETLSRQLWELVITFALYPEPLFGGALKLVLFTALPAGFIGYVPIRAIQHASLAWMAVAGAAALAYVWLGAVVFERGLRRYASGSRFVSFG